MPNKVTQLDRVFYAMSDPTRRSVLERLSISSATVSELAQPFDMALPSFTQHLNVLKDCGLVNSQKTGRVRTYQLSPLPLKAAEEWMVEQREIWEVRFNQLDTYLNKIKEKE
jgi:DNA-binding transcriptional ArsR family regulator